MALRIQQARAQHEIAHGAGGHAARPGQAGGHATAQRRARPEMRRLESQHLAVLGQRRLELGQRRTRARRHHQFRRLVADDAAIRGHIQQAVAILRRHGTMIAVKPFGAATDDEQRLVTGARRHHLIAQLRQDEIHDRTP